MLMVDSSMALADALDEAKPANAQIDIANKAYIQNVADFYISFGPVLGYTAPPRTFGGSVAYKW
jgi:hypothetical protein